MKENIGIKDDSIILKINKDIYPKEVVVQTTYVLLEDYYFLIDEMGRYYMVHMRKKPENDSNISLEECAYQFFDELIESQSYIDQLKRTSKIREIILERALLGQTLDDETIESLKDDEN